MFDKYDDPNYADDWFQQHVIIDKHRFSKIVDRMKYNDYYKQTALHKFDDIVYRISGLFANEVRSYIKHHYYIWLEDAFPSLYCLHISFVAYSQMLSGILCVSGSVSETSKSWSWSLDDIENIIQEQSFFENNSDSDSDVPSSVSNELLPVHTSVLNPACAEYLQKHKCYTKDDYCRKWQSVGQKKIVPGCYIILNCDNHKVYVGQAQDIWKRMRQHFDGKSSDKRDNIDYAITISHDPILIRHLPLGKCGYFDLNEMERDLIKAYDCMYPKGYNKTKGNGYN